MRHRYEHLLTGAGMPSVSEVTSLLKQCDIRAVDDVLTEIRGNLTGPRPSRSAVLSLTDRLWEVVQGGYRGERVQAEAELGTLAHRLFQRAMSDDAVMPDEVPVDLAATWQSFSLWYEDRRPKPVMVEVRPSREDGEARHYHAPGSGLLRPASELSMLTPVEIAAEQGYGGTTDLLADVVIDGCPMRVVIDFKNRTATKGSDGEPRLPAMGPATELQLGAYGALAQANGLGPIHGGIAVLLARNEPFYREDIMSAAAMSLAFEEFMLLRASMTVRKQRKPHMTASRKAGRKAGRAA
jgi:hypothetical protein